MNKRIILCVPTELSKALNVFLTQNNCDILRDIPYLSRTTVNDFIELNPDVIIISEYVTVDTELTLIQALQMIKAQINVQIIVHLNERKPGDRLISQLIGIAIYDFIAVRSFNLNDFIQLMDSPKNFNDVARYYLYFMDTNDSPLPKIEVPEKYKNQKDEELAETHLEAAEELDSKPSWKESVSDIFKNLQEFIPKTKVIREEKPVDKSESTKGTTEINPSQMVVSIQSPTPQSPSNNSGTLDYEGDKRRSKVAREWLPIVDIVDSCVYETNGNLLTMLIIHSENMGLSDHDIQQRLDALENLLREERDELQIFSIERPVKLNYYFGWLQEKINHETNATRKKLLQGTLRQATKIAISGQVKERLFCLNLTAPAGRKHQLENRVKALIHKLNQAKLKAELCNTAEILEIYSLSANPLQNRVRQ